MAGALSLRSRSRTRSQRRLCDSWRSFLLQEYLWLDTGLLEDGAQGPFGHIAGMVGNGGVAVGGRVVPDLMAAGGLAMKLHPQRFEPPGDIAVAKTGEPSHQVAMI